MFVEVVSRIKIVLKIPSNNFLKLNLCWLFCLSVGLMKGEIIMRHHIYSRPFPHVQGLTHTWICPPPAHMCSLSKVLPSWPRHPLLQCLFLPCFKEMDLLNAPFETLVRNKCIKEMLEKQALSFINRLKFRQNMSENNYPFPCSILSLLKKDSSLHQSQVKVNAMSCNTRH